MSTAPTPTPRLLLVSGLLGCAAGAIEVALRAEPSHGSTTGEVLLLTAVAMGLGGGVGLAGAGVASLLPRRREDVAAGLLCSLLAVTTWRYEAVLNAFLWEPRAWAGMLACGLAGAVCGVALAPVLRRPRAPLAAALAAAGCVPVALVRVHADPAPHAPREGAVSFLVVTLDTVRRDRLPPYGSDLKLPHMARLAAEGVVFDDAVASAPITEPSHLAMFTGISPLRSGVVSNGTPLSNPPFIWRALRDAGWATAGFVSGFPLHGKWGWDAGFDVYDDDFGAIAGVQRLTLVKAWNQVALRDHALRERPAVQTLTRAVPWLRAHRDTPTFTWVHLYDAHGPYESAYNAELGPAPRSGARLPLPGFWPEDDRAITDASWLTRAYDNELRTLDDALGTLLEALGPAIEQTVVIVTSDHGEALGEHDTWFDHGDTLYDEVLRVPLIVRLPERLLAGRRVRCQVGLIDLAPTVAEFAGVHDTSPREGRSLGAQLRGGPCPDAAEVVATTVAGRHVENPTMDRAIRVASADDSRVKLIVKGDGARERYDLAADPAEMANLAPDAMSDALYTRLQSGATDTFVAPSTDPDTRDALEALGYVER